MVAWQRIWMLCMLAIAGSGPLPLWLHHIVCHGPHSCAHAHGDAPSSQHVQAHCCGHNHAARPAATSAKSVKQTVQWQSASDSHEDCAACYTLSQLTTAEPTNASLVVHLFCQYVGPVGDAQANLQSLSAYSSRGPPTV